MILKNLVADELAIHVAYPSPGGKVSAMEPDRRNLLQHFDDPPATWGSLVGGLAILLLLLAAVTSWDFIAVLFGCLDADRSEEHTSELQSLMRISYAVFCLKKKNNTQIK